MKKENPAGKSAALWLIFSLITSVSFVCGIVMIPVFAGKIPWLMWIGIALTAHGFYGLAFYWQAFAKCRKLAALVDAIVREDTLDVKELAAHFGDKEEYTVQQIRECVRRGYLPGYRFDGEKLIKAVKRNEEGGRVVVCTCCGAKNFVTEKNRRCEYCGALLDLPYEEK